MHILHKNIHLPQVDYTLSWSLVAYSKNIQHHVQLPCYGYMFHSVVPCHISLVPRSLPDFISQPRLSRNSGCKIKSGSGLWMRLLPHSCLLQALYIMLIICSSFPTALRALMQLEFFQTHVTTLYFWMVTAHYVTQ